MKRIGAFTKGRCIGWWRALGAGLVGALLTMPGLAQAAELLGGGTGVAGVDLDDTAGLEALTKTQLFTVAPTDMSVNFLGQLFGNVDFALVAGTGGHGQLLAHVFSIFNMGMWVIAGSFVMYTTVSSVINTAQDGGQAGPTNKLSGWVPIRVVGGMALLIPKFTGYSLIQVLVMWAVVQGVGLANAAWNEALAYVEQGHQVLDEAAFRRSLGLVSGQDVNARNAQYEEVAKVLPSMADMLSASVCAIVTQDAKELADAQAEDRPAAQVRGPAYKIDETRGELAFGPAGVCGTYSWVASPYPRASKAAFVQVALDLERVAEGVVDQVKQPPKDSAGKATSITTQPCFTETQLAPVAAFKNYRYCRTSQALIQAARAYLAVLQPARVQAAQNNESETTAERPRIYQKAREQGWIMAGRYYQKMVDNRAGTVTLAAVSLPEAGRIKVPKATVLTDAVKQALPESGDQKLLNTALGAIKNPLKADSEATFYGQAKKMYALEKDTLIASQATDNAERNKELEALANRIKGNQSDSEIGLANELNRYINAMVRNSVGAWSLHVLGRKIRDGGGDFDANLSVDPLARLRSLGKNLFQYPITFWTDATQHIIIYMTTVSLTFQAFMYAAALAGAASGSTWGVNITRATTSALGMIFQMITALIFMYLPLGLAIATPLFLMGLTLGVYVPLIPYILFTFAGIGWLIAVIEAMIAAPLVALGVTHPEGHDLLGKAEQSLMLLLGVFIRPVAIVMGFLAGIVLSAIALQLLDYGFLGLMGDFLDPTKSILHFGGDYQNATMAGTVGLMVVYTFTAMTLINLAYGTIHQVPDRIMRWIGGPQEQSQDTQMLEQVRQGSEQRLGEGAQGAGQTASGVRQAGIAPGGVHADRKSPEDKQNEVGGKSGSDNNTSTDSQQSAENAAPANAEPGEQVGPSPAGPSRPRPSSSSAQSPASALRRRGDDQSRRDGNRQGGSE